MPEEVQLILLSIIRSVARNMLESGAVFFLEAAFFSVPSWLFVVRKVPGKWDNNILLPPGLPSDPREAEVEGESEFFEKCDHKSLLSHSYWNVR